MKSLTKKLKIGVVGAGGEARLYLQDYFLSDLADVTIVQDIDEEKLAKVADKFNIKHRTTSFQEILESDVDIVDVSTPNYLHAEQTIAALRAGKDVIVQKPMAPTIAECELMIEEARKNKHKLGVYMSALNDPLNHELKRMIDSKFFGTISSVRSRGAHLGGLLMKPDNNLWRHSLQKTGGGVFIQLAVHSIHFLEWALSSKIERVAAFSKNLMCKDRLEGDDITTAIGELSSGANITLESSYCSLGGMMEVYGSEGYYVRHGDEITIYSSNKFEGEVIAHPGHDLEIKIFSSSLRDKINKLQSEYNQHQSFIRAIAEDKEPPTPGEDGLRGVKVVKAVYEAANTGKTIRVK